MIYSTARWVALRTILQTLFLIAILLTVSKTVGARPAPYQCSQPHGSLPPTYISMREAANYALAAGFEGENAAIIVAIAWAESDPPGNIFSCGKNADGSWDRGILQINDFWIKHGVDDACAFDPACAFKAAYKIVYQKYGKTRGFNEWVEYINGGYMKYLDAARQAIQEATQIILNTYLSWGYNIIYSVVPFSLSDLKNLGCGQVWLWDWNRKEWVTDFYVPQFQVYWIYVENSCTVRLRGYAPSGRSWDLAGGKWQVITSTKPWDEIAGGCRLLSGPWFLRQVYWDEGRGEWKWDWQLLSTSEKMDGFHAYWVWVDSSCRTLSALYYRISSSSPLQQPPGGPPSIPVPGPGPGPKPSAPIAPSNLRATAVSSSQITLTWQDNSDNEQGFKIERRVEGGSYSQIATVEANTQSYSDSGLSSEATYCYRVRAYNSAGDSPFSDEACATTGAPPSDRGNPPKASFTFSPPEPKVNETVSFTDQSSDPDNDIVSWSWDFGDGTTSTSQSPAHSYSQAGTYTVRLSVRDSKGNWDSTGRSITVGATPRGIYTLIVNIEPPGSGTVAVLLVNDEPYIGSNPQSFPATYTFQQGSVVSLGVTSIALGYEFIGWEGDVTISESIATVVMDRDKMITANFQKRKSPPSIRGEKTIEEALDLNQNRLIDDNEILQAISYWIAGELVPGTDGKIIDDAKILELMDMWIKGTPRPLSLSEAKVKGTNLAIEVSPKLVRNFSIVRFKVEGTGIAEARIQIFTLAGHLVYDSYFIPGNAFEWRPQTKEGQPLANGVYLYVVRVRGFDGREYVSEVRKLVILR
jgi:PKD repeat protein